MVVEHPPAVSATKCSNEIWEYSKSQTMLTAGRCSTAQHGAAVRPPSSPPPRPGASLRGLLQERCSPSITLYYLWPNDCPLTSGDYTFAKILWVSERAPTSLLSRWCSSEAISSFLSAPCCCATTQCHLLPEQACWHSVLISQAELRKWVKII